MKTSLIASILVAVLAIGGISLLLYLAPSGPPSAQSSTQSHSVTTSVTSSITTSITTQGSPVNPGFGCARPAIVYQYGCDQLPAGYLIAPKTPVGPEPYCPSQMTQSACALLKQTFGNGVCDPNETVWTSPLDCSCPTATIGDPYTGRCGVPATVCQLVPIG